MTPYTINMLDTITNLIMLLAVILPVYILTLSHIIGDVPTMAYKPVKVTVNGHMRIITIRNPYNNKWITTITLSHTPANAHQVIQPLARPIAAFSNPYRFAMGLMVILLLSACGPLESTEVVSPESKVSTQYVADGYSTNKACWWATEKGDSLKVEGRKYTISERSRYRVARLDVETIDNLLKGDVWVNDWAFYRDTKRDDTVYVFNRCDYPNLGGD